ncbi:MAG: hypothetical protein ACXADF_14890 [Candidatus Thorarchaeota archaeon]
MRRLLTRAEEREVLDALRDFLKNRPGALGNLRKLAKRILSRIDPKTE